MNDDITRLLLERRLQEALVNLQTALYAFPTGAPWELQKEYTDISRTYSYLLDYFRQGSEDSEREHVFTELIGRALLLNDSLKYTSKGESIELRSLMLFDEVASPTPWSKSLLTEAQSLLRDCPADGKGDTSGVCLLMSAVMLSLLRCFDPMKIELLCEAASSAATDVAVRAVTALSLCCRKHKDRLEFYPDTIALLKHLGEDDAFLDMLTDVELMLLQSRDTEEIERRMREEIIPAMLRNPKLKDKPIISANDLQNDDANPEWQKWLEESGVEENLRELTELQMNGADIYTCTFSHLKHYPFFSQLKNWFLPFSPRQADVASLFTDANATTLQRLILQSPVFCNSDKYSFCLTLRQLPESQLEALRSQMQEQEEQLDEDAKSSLDAITDSQRANGVSPRTLVRQYVQDLYRFFFLHPKRNLFDNPFRKSDEVKDYEDAEALLKLFPLPLNSLQKIIELNFKRKDYVSAHPYLIIIQENYPEATDATYWQKLGFTYQKMNNPSMAVDAYDKADLLDPDRYWTISHMARCLYDSNDKKTSLSWYDKAAAMKPDNLQITYRQASCLFACKRYEDALTPLYKLLYHEPDSMKSLSLIVKTLLLLGRAEQADKYAETMLTHINDMDDDMCFVCGCQRWVRSQRDEALYIWAQAISPVFVKDFMTQIGIADSDTHFIAELLRRYKQENC